MAGSLQFSGLRIAFILLRNQQRQLTFMQRFPGVEIEQSSIYASFVCLILTTY